MDRYEQQHLEARYDDALDERAKLNARLAALLLRQDRLIRLDERNCDEIERVQTQLQRLEGDLEDIEDEMPRERPDMPIVL